MPQHDSEYFAKLLEEMLEQSAPRMLVWVTRWKIGIYQSFHQAKLLSKQKTIPIWKIWEPDRTEEPKKKWIREESYSQNKRNIKQQELRPH